MIIEIREIRSRCRESMRFRGTYDILQALSLGSIVRGLAIQISPSALHPRKINSMFTSTFETVTEIQYNVTMWNRCPQRAPRSTRPGREKGFAQKLKITM